MQLPIRKQQIPWAMSGVRAALGPVLIAGAACNWSGTALAALVLSALVSDIYDGILARRWHCDTAALRLFDSMADTFFYLCTGLALWIHSPDVLLRNGIPLLALVAAEGLHFGFDCAKFGKPASYHSYLAKSWGLAMAIAVMAAFASGRGVTLVALSLSLGILCNVEGLLMSAVLPVWTRDVPSLSAAWALRRETMPVHRAGSGPIRRLPFQRAWLTILCNASPNTESEEAHR